MKQIFFIYPNPNRTSPRGIRISNIIKELKLIEPDNIYYLLTFRNSFTKKKNTLSPTKINYFNWIYLVFRYLGIFKIGHKLIEKAKVLDPYLFIHFVIKADLKLRLKNIKQKDCIFVVVVSPFSNYLLVPWLRSKYPKAKIICDIGDPLYKNSARWNDDQYSKQIEYNAITSSNSLIVTNENTKFHYINEFNLDKVEVSIIPQGVNTQLINDNQKHIEEKSFSLAYAGKFYKQLRSPNELYKFISNQKKYMLNIYGVNDVYDIDNVVFHGSFKQDVLFYKLKENEVLIFIENKKGMQLSGKIYELLAFNKPILYIKGDEITPTYHLARQYENVFFAENNSESIKGSLMKYESQKGKIEKYDIESFSWANRATQYLKLL